jgi:uncharacterized protein (DUF3820 family)
MNGSVRDNFPVTPIPARSVSVPTKCEKGQYPRAIQAKLIREFNTTMKPEDLKKLVTFAMPYGKYKGRVIADLPGHYLNWFAREGFPGGELGRLLALMQEMDHNGLKPLLDPLRK